MGPKKRTQKKNVSDNQAQLFQLGFSDDSMKKLISNGFDSLEVLQLLRGNNGAIEDLDLDLA